MIIDSSGMKKIEASGTLSSYELMELAGRSVAEEIRKETSASDVILFLAGKGNNGGDAYVACRELKDRKCFLIPVDGKPAAAEAVQAASLLNRKLVRSAAYFDKALKQADVVVDAVYGFSYRGELKPQIRQIFDKVSCSKARVFSIDINSGCEADTGRCDSHALHSEITYVLDCYKPFHMLKKDHHMFERTVRIDLHLPHEIQTMWPEMDEDEFFRNFPKKADNAYKGTFGKTLLCGGCFGMAGALSLNITGAKTVGAPYINAALPDSIYPVVASHHITPVFHPFGYDNAEDVLRSLIKDADAAAFGSGAVNMYKSRECMDLLLQECRCPVILDAAALRLLKHNTYIFRFVRTPVILTPHIGEFADLINRPTAFILSDRITCAKEFAKENNVYLVLKGPHTIAVSPDGQCYINQTGNQALAQAGSGDLLTGIMAGLLTMTKDVYKAVCMAVWLHGYLADIGTQYHSIQNFPIEKYPEIMDRLLMKHGF
ncbi:MAG: NAD(P)H-hydrate dehydratase [Solobacterium sp.]|nr:NAD(P)H-hydrate dehydratase [Solobacterium sp.]